MKREEYTVVSLFSGGMGLDVGIEQTGRFRVVACVEKEPAYAKDAQGPLVGVMPGKSRL